MTKLALPAVLPRPGGWEFTWKAEEINIRLERLREHHDSITSEVWVEQGTKREHLLGGIRFNLVSTTGRAGVAKFLLSRRNGLDWGGMIEQVCVYTLKKFREQEQPGKLGYFPKDNELKFLLAPVIPTGVSTLLFGYGGMAKTTIALAWGLLVQLGEARLGLKPEKSPVLLLDWETHQDIANGVLMALHAGLKLEGGADFIYRRCRRPLLEFVEDVKADVDREGIGLIILDSMGKACGSEKELKENALPTMSALEWLGKTNLIVSHRPKGFEGKERGTYGSVYIENDVRQAFRVEAQAQPGENMLNVALYHTKHNLMSLLNPIGYSITWDKVQGTFIKTKDVAEMEAFRPHLSAKDQITQELKETPKMTVAELAEATGLKENTISKALEREKKRFVTFEVDNIKMWGLKSQREDEKISPLL